MRRQDDDEMKERSRRWVDSEDENYLATAHEMEVLERLYPRERRRRDRIAAL